MSIIGPIKRTEGVTTTERYLNKLCNRTFLSLWSHPGIYRNQGHGNGGDGKEVCDLLVVFEQHIIILSDKNCHFPDSGDLATDWNRWFKRAIQESAKQTWGAERWITTFPERLFLDRSCSQPFPIQLPDLKSAKFHLVVVAHDSSTRCQRELGGSGSLMIHSDIKGQAHFSSSQNPGTPLAVGDINPDKTFVHVFDDTTLDIIMETLDTIYDFVTYLDKKEKFLRGDSVVIAAGEEDLLAFYLKDIDDNGEHDFIVSADYNAIYIDEGHWIDFCARPERQTQLSANDISYAWDRLIETFSKHALDGTHYYTSHPGILPPNVKTTK